MYSKIRNHRKLRVAGLFQLAMVASTALVLSACGSSTGADPAAPTPQAPGSKEVMREATPVKTVPAAPELRLSDAAKPLAYIVNLTIDPNKASFRGDVRINLELATAADHLWLHGTDLTIDKAVLKTDTETLAVERIPTKSEQFLGFTFPKAVGGRVWLEVSYSGKVSDKDWTGLFRQEDSKNWYLYSQGEALGARRIFPSFDEPRWKVPFTTTLTVPKGMRAFANAPVKSTTPAADGMVAHVFETTKPLPSYLFAVAAGPFELVAVGPVGRNKTPVRIIALKGKTDRLEFAKQAAIKTQIGLEDYFDMAYPYRKLDHIAVPRFLGAMENPGLITYDAGLLRAPKTQSWGFERRSAGVIAHEVAHQWFGNLVTLAWWDDIWLNESFATWLSAKIVDQWKPEWKGTISSIGQRSSVMASDSLISARKIRNPIRTNSDIAGAFDGITYGKGSAMLWMFEETIGHEAFRKGMREYMRTHAWKTTTADDFLASIGKVSHPVIPEAFKTFLDQPGLPVLSASITCTKGKKPTLSLSQKRYLPAGSKGSTDQVWKIPVCISVDKGVPGKACSVMTKQTEERTLHTKAACPRWVNVNAGATGYYRVAYQGKLLSSLITKAGKRLSPAERINLIGDLSAQVDADQVGVGDALSFLPKLLKDKSPFVIESALGILGKADRNLVPEKLEPNMARFIRKTFGKRARKLGWKSRKGDDDQTKKLRSRLLPLVATRGQDKKLQKQVRAMADVWLKTGKGVEPDDVAEVLGTSARHGDAALYDQIRKKLDATEDNRARQSLVTALASFRDRKLVKRNLDLFLADSKLPLRASFALLGGGLRFPATREMAYSFIKKNHAAIMDKMPSMARGYIVFVAQAFCDKAHYDDAKAFFGPIAKKELQGEKLLAQTLEGIDLCMSFVKVQRPKVVKFLKKY